MISPELNVLHNWTDFTAEQALIQFTDCHCWQQIYHLSERMPAAPDPPFNHPLSPQSLNLYNNPPICPSHYSPGLRFPDFGINTFTPYGAFSAPRIYIHDFGSKHFTLSSLFLLPAFILLTPGTYFFAFKVLFTPMYRCYQFWAYILACPNTDSYSLSFIL